MFDRMTKATDRGAPIKCPKCGEVAPPGDPGASQTSATALKNIEDLYRRAKNQHARKCAKCETQYETR